MILTLVALTVATAAALVPPYLAGQAVDAITDKDSGRLTVLLIVFVGAALLNWGATYVQTFLINWVGQRALQDLRIQIFRHLQRLSIGFYSRNKAGVLISRLTNDVQALDQLVTEGMQTLFSSTLTLDRHHGDPAAARPGARARHLPDLPAPAHRAASSSGWRPRARTGSRASGSPMVTAYLQETLSGVRVVRAFGQEGRHTRRFAELNDQHREANMRTVNLNAAYFPAVELLSTVATAVILIYGGNRVLDGQASIGVLVSFVFYLQSFFDPIQSLSQLYTTYQAGMAALDKIFELLDEEPDIRDRPDALELPRLRGEIEFDDVTFAYGEGEPALLRRVPARPAGPDRGARGRHRRRQVHPRQARGALLRPGPRPGARGRPRPARRDRAVAALAARDRAPGELPVLGHDPRQHRLRPGRRHGRGRARRGRARSAPTPSSSAFPRATTPRSASAAGTCPPASASWWRSPARPPPTRAC